MQGIFQKENTDKALKYGIYRHLQTYEKIIRNLVSFYYKNPSKNIGQKNFSTNFSGGFRGGSNEDTPFLDYFIPAKLL